MAQKVRTFAEYDVKRKERQLDLAPAASSKLEQMIRANIRRNENRFGGIEIIAHHPFTTISLKMPREIMRLYLGQQMKVYQPKAEQEAFLEYFQQNMRELIGCGVSMSKSHHSLDDSQKQSFYVRFLDNLKELAEEQHFAPFKARYPEIEKLVRGFHPPKPEEPKFQEVMIVTDGLRREKYINRENADMIIQLLSSQPETQAFPTRTLATRRKTPAPISGLTAMTSPNKSTKEEQLEYLAIIFCLDADQANYIAQRVTLEQLEETHHEMKSMVGEDNFLKMVNMNPAILLYQAEKTFTKYHRTLGLVLGRIRKNGDKESLEQRFGIENNLEQYASLEKLVKLKQELFTITGEYTKTTPAETISDLEDYKDRLLLKAGLNTQIVRAYTHGKTALFKGDYYIPREYFRKNAAGKVPAQILDQHGEEVFDHLVKLKVITKKPKAVNPLYRLNPHIKEITNPYLREYMRVTLYAAQILTQEGKINQQINFHQE